MLREPTLWAVVLIVFAGMPGCDKDKDGEGDRQPAPPKVEPPPAEPKYGKANPPPEDVWYRMLAARRVSFEFVDTPIGEALTFFCSLAMSNLVVDPKALSRPGMDRKVTLRVKDMVLPEALDLICKQAGLVWIYRYAAMFVTTPELLGGDGVMELEIYTVQDILPPEDMCVLRIGPAQKEPVGRAALTGVQLVKDIKNCDAALWEKPGASIEETGRKLVAVQTSAGHAQVRAYLAGLRRGLETAKGEEKKPSETR